MTEEQPKRRLKKPIRIALTAIGCLAMVCGTIFFIISIKKEVDTTFSLKDKIKEYDEEIARLEEEKEFLINQKEKLSDENYVLSVARGKYLITIDGEQIFVLPSLDY